MKLSMTSGAYVRLKDLFRERPAVLFYEDKDSTSVNQPLKEALFAIGKQKGMLGAVTVVAVANVTGFDWFPARNFVVAAVRDSERAIGIPIYLDWSGALTRPPWSLKPEKATVVVLDRSGAVSWVKHGKVQPKEIDELIARLGGLIEAK